MDVPFETRSAEPAGNDTQDDTLDAATQAVEELKTAVEQKGQALDKRLSDSLKDITKRLDAIDVRTQRPGASEQKGHDGEGERKAFTSFLRRGAERMDDIERRNLTVSTDTAGGYLAPEQFIAELIRNIVLYSPIRQVARVAPTSAGEVILPKRTGTLTASWVAETANRPATQPAYGQQRMSVHEMACYVDVSNWLLEDSVFDMNGELARDFAEEFGRLESATLIAGDGTNKPSGLLLDPNVPVVRTAATTTITPDELIDLYHALPSFYAANATWVMNRQTIGRVRKMKLGDSYVWQEPITAGNPATILGRPVVEFPDMPDVAANTIVAAFGDFQQGFRIFDRVGLTVLRDPYSLATNGQVRFHARRRVTGGVVRPEAIRFLQMKAS